MERRGRDDFGEATAACVQDHIEPGRGSYKPLTNSGLSLAAWSMGYGLWAMVYGRWSMVFEHYYPPVCGAIAGVKVKSGRSVNGLERLCLKVC